MAKTHVQPGKVIDVTVDDDYSSGDLIKVGDLCGVCLGDIADGDTGSVQIEEVFQVKKKTSDTITAGKQLYLDADNKRVTISDNDGASVPTAFIKAGKAIAAASNSDTTVLLKLNV
ncbi:MAG TPA: DUF2190 family protein [Nevskiaceae bacterium]|nr:DUF2190 family protein [Nevskiaceae bacterium]